jgi:CheY-like chemotaxis protein/HPt (histidine-containing phosphotransfer) domain-containing protein
MSTLVSESMVARLVESARQQVVEGMASIAKYTPEATVQLANHLHTIAGEAAMLDKPDVAKAAAEGEDAARLVAGGKLDALVPCMRALRRLGYLLQEAAEPDRKSNGNGRGVQAGPRRLLIVDDSPVAALALADVFEMHDFSVRVASTIEKAIEHFASFSPTVLVSDVHMPNLDVGELCRGFRAASAGTKIAVILVSGRTESELRERIDEIKPDAFVCKLSGAAAVVTRVGAICRELFV